MSVSMIDPFSPLSVSWVKPLPGALIVHDHVPIKPLLKLNMLVQKSSDALLTISSPWRWGARIDLLNPGVHAVDLAKPIAHGVNPVRPAVHDHAAAT